MGASSHEQGEGSARWGLRGSRLDPILALNPPPGWVVDVGSRDGDDCAALVAAIPGASGVAVEARPEAAELIRQRHPELVVLPYAVHEFDGTTGFAVLESDDLNVQGSSGFRAERGGLFGVPVRVIEVECRRLDGILPPGIISVLKVDVEGFTLEALHGLGDRIRDVQVAHLETETDLREGPPWFEPMTSRAVCAFMLSHGFRLVAATYEWGPSIEDQVWVRG